MAEKVWKEMTPKLVEGYRKIPVVQDNPNWWMVEIFDCFVVHLCNIEALNFFMMTISFPSNKRGVHPMLTNTTIYYSKKMIKQCIWIHLDTYLR